MAKRAKAPSAPNSVQSHEDLIKAVAKKGEYDRAAEVSASVAERLITEIKEDLALQLTPLGKASKQLVKDIQGYAEAHRAENRRDGHLVEGQAILDLRLRRLDRDLLAKP